MTRFLRAGRALALPAAVLAGCALGPVAPAQADPAPPCSVYQAPIYAHPGKERSVYVACGGPIYPTDITADAPAHGTLTRATSLWWRYKPAAGYTGPDHFTLHPTDAGGPWAPIEVDVTVDDAVNGAPTCGWGATTTVRTDEATLVHLPSCEDPEGDAMHFEIVAPPGHGSLWTLVPKPTAMDIQADVPYAPTPGYIGTDSFTYRVVDDHGGQSPAQVATITVTAASFNRPPTCLPPIPWNLPGMVLVPIHGPTRMGTGCNDPDRDPITYAITTPPAHGTMTVGDHSTFSYVPEPGFAGTDTFAFTASDDHGGVVGPLNRELIVGPNHAPSCSATTVTAARRAAEADPPTTVALPCSDEDRDQLFATLTAPAHGRLTFDDRYQRLTYTPDAGFEGTDSATIVADDHMGATSAPAALTFAVGDPPKDDGGSGGAKELPATPGPTPPSARDRAAQAATLLGPKPRGLALGFGSAVQAFTAAAPTATGPLAVVFCPKGCTVQVGARLVLTGTRAHIRAAASVKQQHKPAAGLALARRTLRIAASKPGVVRLTLTRSQRAKLAQSRRASVVLTLTTRIGATTRTARATLALRR